MLRINVNVNMNILRVHMLLILYICEVVYIYSIFLCKFGFWPFFMKFYEKKLWINFFNVLKPWSYF